MLYYCGGVALDICGIVLVDIRNNVQKNMGLGHQLIMWILDMGGGGVKHVKKLSTCFIDSPTNVKTHTSETLGSTSVPCARIFAEFI